MPVDVSTGALYPCLLIYIIYRGVYRLRGVILGTFDTHSNYEFKHERLCLQLIKPHKKLTFDHMIRMINLGHTQPLIPP